MPDPKQEKEPGHPHERRVVEEEIQDSVRDEEEFEDEDDSEEEEDETQYPDE